MIESGVIRYGKEFEKSLHEGGWDVSKVDTDELAKSQATLVFGQMKSLRSTCSCCPLRTLSS